MEMARKIKDIAVGVIGAGSWGTALADLLARKGYPVTIWSYEKEVAEAINERRENGVYLKGARLSGNLVATTDLETATRGKGLVLMVVPSHVMAETAQVLKDWVEEDAIVVTASKGIENATFRSMTDILEEELGGFPPSRLAVLSGPSFAREVAENRPTSVTSASTSLKTAKYVQEVFSTPEFRVYTTTDVVGVEVGGAMKNVIAIAAGFVDGVGLGLNTRAALITRGLAEIRRLGLALGANPHTFSGLSGVGDLMLTCTGSLSRNHTVGQKIGEGKTIGEILSEMRMVAEGVKSAKSVHELGERLGVDLPISSAVHEVLHEGGDPATCLRRILTRSLKAEFEFDTGSDPEDTGEDG